MIVEPGYTLIEECGESPLTVESNVYPDLTLVGHQVNQPDRWNRYARGRLRKPRKLVDPRVDDR